LIDPDQMDDVSHKSVSSDEVFKKKLNKYIGS